MQYKKIVDYWQKIAVRDYEVMQSLFDSKHYPEALFFGQLTLEKVLKALVVENIKKNAPKTHDLVRLAKLADVRINNQEKTFLDEMTRFNLEARYPDYKLRIIRLATKKFTQSHLLKVKKMVQIYGKKK